MRGAVVPWLRYRHHRWISKDHAQPDLTAQPEILRAHRRHRWLIRRHGRDPVMRALRDAQRICIGWRLDGLRDPGFARRMEIFCGPGWDDRDEWACPSKRSPALAGHNRTATTELVYRHELRPVTTGAEVMDRILNASGRQ